MRDWWLRTATQVPSFSIYCLKGPSTNRWFHFLILDFFPYHVWTFFHFFVGLVHSSCSWPRIFLGKRSWCKGTLDSNKFTTLFGVIITFLLVDFAFASLRFNWTGKFFCALIWTFFLQVQRRRVLEYGSPRRLFQVESPVMSSSGRNHQEFLAFDDDDLSSPEPYWLSRLKEHLWYCNMISWFKSNKLSFHSYELKILQVSQIFGRVLTWAAWSTEVYRMAKLAEHCKPSIFFLTLWFTTSNTCLSVKYYLHQ